MEPVGPKQGIRFPTGTLPERDRLPHLREVIGRSIIGMDLEPFQGRPLRWAASWPPAGSAVSYVLCQALRARLRRSPHAPAGSW
jgi:hypothetical protein